MGLDLYRVSLIDAPRGRQRKQRTEDYVVMAVSSSDAIQLLRDERPQAFIYQPTVSASLWGSRIVRTT